jgi:hypothetical protein
VTPWEWPATLGDEAAVDVHVFGLSAHPDCEQQLARVIETVSEQQGGKAPFDAIALGVQPELVIAMAQLQKGQRQIEPDRRLTPAYFQWNSVAGSLGQLISTSKSQRDNGDIQVGDKPAMFYDRVWFVGGNPCLKGAAQELFGTFPGLPNLDMQRPCAWRMEIGAHIGRTSAGDIFTTKIWMCLLTGFREPLEFGSMNLIQRMWHKASRWVEGHKLVQGGQIGRWNWHNMVKREYGNLFAVAHIICGHREWQPKCVC